LYFKTKINAMKLFFIVGLCAVSVSLLAQETSITVPNDTALVNTKTFAYSIVAGTNDNYEKAKILLGWLSSHFEWKATDYQKRTVKEIIVRQGGNCFELATVYMALLKELNLNYRPIAEINIHVYSEERGKTADEKIKQSGNRMSVFGKQHNDHRWVEIYDDKTGEWVPADPTMNIIGFDQWLKARAWFGERHTINDEFSGDMIAPFAIFVVNNNNKSLMEENRTLYYMVTKLDQLYGGQLSKLPSWSKWVSGLQNLSVAAKKAFEGEENLHNYTDQISELANVYQNLKKEYLATRRR
jgi:transglutaminase superfamily protein